MCCIFSSCICVNACCFQTVYLLAGGPGGTLKILASLKKCRECVCVAPVFVYVCVCVQFIVCVRWRVRPVSAHAHAEN